MPELSIFDTDLSQRVFLIGSIFFIALYAGGILFLRERAVGGTDRMTVHGRAAASALLIVAAVTAVAGAMGVFSNSSGATSQPASISISALHSTVDTDALPVQQVDNPF